jgi:cation transport ATPase
MRLTRTVRPDCCFTLQVVHTTALDGFTSDEVVRLAACVERGASHPLAAAIVGLAASRGVPLVAAVSDSREVPGQVCRMSAAATSAPRPFCSDPAVPLPVG